jgi:hypothetical protein
MASYGSYTRTLDFRLCADIFITSQKSAAKQKCNCFTDICGKNTTEKSKKTTTFITKMGIPRITESKILNASIKMSIGRDTKNKEAKMEVVQPCSNTSKESERMRPSGIRVKKGENGIRNTEKPFSETCIRKKRHTNAVFLENLIKYQQTPVGQNIFAQTSAMPKREGNLASMTRLEHALFVKND